MSQVSWTTSKGNEIEVAVERSNGETVYTLTVDGESRKIDEPHKIKHPSVVGVIGGNVGLTQENWDAIRKAADEVYVYTPATDHLTAYDNAHDQIVAAMTANGTSC